jgi:hypothetical protein
MSTLRNLLAAAAVGLSLTAVTAAQAAPTETPQGGITTVRLSPAFLHALNSLNVTPAAIAPGGLASSKKGVLATFPITAGAVDLGKGGKAELDHSGGLSFTAGPTRVELTAFIIDLTGNRPVLTGLVTVQGDLVGRAPLFDLALGTVSVITGDFLKVDNVTVKLSKQAADALNAAFGVTVFKPGTVIGTAFVRTTLEFEGP